MKTQIINEVSKYIKRHCKISNIKDNKEINAIKNRVVNDIINDSYDFEKNIRFKKTTRYGKQRLVTFFKPFSTEFYLSKYIAKTIKNQANLPSKNPHKLLDSFLESLNKIENSNDFTVVMFDFKDYYNSISSKYVYNFILEKMSFEKEDKKLIKAYSSQVSYAFAGLAPSNIFGDMMAKEFEKKLIENLKDKKLIKIVSACDDFAFVLNKACDKQDISDIISKTLSEIFYNKTIEENIKNKVNIYLHGDKFSYISSANLPAEFNYFGYRVTIFNENNIIDFKLGVSTGLKKLYIKHLQKMILENYQDIEKLRTLLLLNSKRFVYTKKSVVNESRIVSLNYIQDKMLLKKYLSKVSEDSLNFYKNIILDTFTELNIPLPYYLKDKNQSSGYNLYANLLKNKAVVLHYKIGLKKDKINAILKQVRAETGKKTNYLSLQKNLKDFVITKK